MKNSLAEKLCCPIDKHSLTLKVFLKDEADNIIEGIFTCPVCSRYYPIIYGIPVMTPDEYREKLLEEPLLKKWEVNVDIISGRDFLLNEC